MDREARGALAGGRNISHRMFNRSMGEGSFASLPRMGGVASRGGISGSSASASTPEECFALFWGAETGEEDSLKQKQSSKGGRDA